MRFALALLLALPLCGCEIVYKLPTRQGNVLEQKELDTLRIGMSREQVRFILGTPIATSAFRNDRWDYVGYYKNPRGKVYSRTVSLFFEGDTLARMEGEKAPDGSSSQPDLETLEKEEQKAATEAERAAEKTDSGIIITPKKADGDTP
jgi:outer membrane protein assembly factor BamE